MRKGDQPTARPLDPVEPYRVIMRITLSAGKAAELCGVSRRQLCYWADKGIIKAAAADSAGEADASRRVYDLRALHRAFLIKREMDRGRSLQRAVQEVDRLLRAHTERRRELASASPAEREQFLVGQSERLANIARRLREAAAARPGSDALLPLVRVLALLPEAGADSEAAGGLRDDPEACCRLADALERVAGLLDDLGAKSAP